MKFTKQNTDIFSEVLDLLLNATFDEEAFPSVHKLATFNPILKSIITDQSAF